MRAQPHPDEELRLAELRRYDILDTPSEPAFDELVQLAAEICETPIALISLVDENRQWFKAKVGIEVDQTERDSSICSHSILEDGLLEIPDTRLDERTSDNPLCLDDPNIRFYAGVPVNSREGIPLGTLCVIDRKPRELTDVQRQTLHVLANQVKSQIELRQALKREILLRKEVDHRVKNSLQAVSALARLQANRTDDMTVKAALEQIDARVLTIAATHEELHRFGTGNEVQVRYLFERMCSLFRGLLPAKVRMSCRADHLVVTPGEAQAIGTILTEFVLNALKHGFVGNAGGTIELSGIRDGQHYRMVCRDTGGADSGAVARIRESKGLGSRLITTSAKQLKAVPEWSISGGGLNLSVEWPTDS